MAPRPLGTAVTKHHTPGGSGTIGIDFSWFWRLGVGWRGWFLVRTLFSYRAADSTLGKPFGGNSLKGTNLTLGDSTLVTLFNHKDLPKAPPPDNHHTGGQDFNISTEGRGIGRRH